MTRDDVTLDDLRRRIGVRHHRKRIDESDERLVASSILLALLGGLPGVLLGVPFVPPALGPRLLIPFLAFLLAGPGVLAALLLRVPRRIAILPPFPSSPAVCRQTDEPRC